MLTFANRQSGKCIRAFLSDEISKDRNVRFHECGLDRIFKVVDEIRFDRSIKIINSAGHKPFPLWATFEWRSMLIVKREFRSPMSEAQEENIIRINHGSVGGVTMCSPDRSAVKCVQ